MLDALNFVGASLQGTNGRGWVKSTRTGAGVSPGVVKSNNTSLTGAGGNLLIGTVTDGLDPRPPSNSSDALSSSPHLPESFRRSLEKDLTRSGFGGRAWDVARERRK